MSNLQTIIRNSLYRLLNHESLSSVSAHSVTDQPAGITTGYRLLRGVSIYNGVALLTASLTPNRLRRLTCRWLSATDQTTEQTVSSVLTV